MNTNLHGIIFSYHASPELEQLVKFRTSASLPFCGSYRIIDFILSSMQNAGVRDVGVIMKHDYQSLLDHLGSGKAWDLSRKRGGLKLLPPFGRSQNDNFTGVIEALCSVETYIRDIEQDYVILSRGNLAANIDVSAVMDLHLKSKADITAVCTKKPIGNKNVQYLVNDDMTVHEMSHKITKNEKAYSPLEVYILSKALLLKTMDTCSTLDRFRFQRDFMTAVLAAGGKISVYEHTSYAKMINSVEGYFKANMDMLEPKKRSSLFPETRPVKTKERSDVSTYYSEDAEVTNSLVADGCIIEGTVENSIIFHGARVLKGAVVKNSIVMQDTIVSEGVTLNYVVSDKDVLFSEQMTLSANRKKPLVVAKGSKI